MRSLLKREVNSFLLYQMSETPLVTELLSPGEVESQLFSLEKKVFLKNDE